MPQPGAGATPRPGFLAHQVLDRDRTWSQGASARRVPSSRLTTAARPQASS